MIVEHIDHMGTDLSVVNAARLAYGRQSVNLTDKDRALIDNLAKQGHMTPFRHPQLSLKIKMPVFVARQMCKHQVGYSWSEQSRRYTTKGIQFYLDPADEFADIYQEQYDKALQVYNKLLALGEKPEKARRVLPLSLCITTIWTGSLLGYAEMLRQRLDKHAQQETRELAKLIEKEVLVKFPVSMSALQRYWK